MKVWVEGIGLVAPGLPGWVESRGVLAGLAPYEATPLTLAAPAQLPSAERRRVGMPVKLALAAGFEAVAHAQRVASDLPSVFTSSGGDPDNVHHICESLAANAREVSPTRFHNSVHNAPSGYWSIAAHARAMSTSIAAHDHSFAAGLTEAAAQLHGDAEAVLLIAYDSPYPEPLHSFRPIEPAFGVALVMARERGANSVAELDIALTRDAAANAAMGDVGLERLRLSVPAARCLPVLAALAAGRVAEPRIAFVAGNQVRVGIKPC